MIVPRRRRFRGKHTVKLPRGLSVKLPTYGGQFYTGKIIGPSKFVKNAFRVRVTSGPQRGEELFVGARNIYVKRGSK